MDRVGVPDLVAEVRDQFARASGGTSPPAPRPAASDRDDRADAAATKRDTTAAVKAFVRALVYELRIPGQHYSGLSNQELFEILGDQGREFDAHTRQLDAHVTTALLQEFEGYGRVPGRTQLAQIAADAILEWVLARMDGKVRDERLAALSYAYARRKRKLHPGKPIGQATGALRDAVADARVHITT